MLDVTILQALQLVNGESRPALFSSKQCLYTMFSMFHQFTAWKASMTVLHHLFKYFIMDYNKNHTNGGFKRDNKVDFIYTCEPEVFIFNTLVLSTVGYLTHVNALERRLFKWSQTLELIVVWHCIRWEINVIEKLYQYCIHWIII